MRSFEGAFIMLKKESDTMATIKMYDAKGNLVDVDRNRQDELLGQGYSFKKPASTSTAPTSTPTSTETKALWEQNPNTGNYYEMDVSTGKALGGEYDSPWGNPVMPDPNANWMAEFKAYQDDLNAARRQSRIAGLDKAYQSSLSGLDAEKATIDPYYYDKRNEAAGRSDVSAMNFAQYMAGRGISGNAGAMPEIYRQAGLNQQIGNLDRQQTADHADIARRKSGLQSAYESDVAAANADIDAQSMEALMRQFELERAQRIADNAAMGLTSTGQQTLAGQTYADQKQRQLEDAYRANIGQYYENFQAQIDKVANDGDPSNDWQLDYLRNARQQKIQTQAEQAAAAAAAASEAEQQAWKNAFELFKANGKITSPEMAQILGLPMNATVADIDIARMNAATSRINANKAKAEAEKPAEGTIASTFGTSSVYNDAKAMLDNGADKNSVIDAVMKSGMLEGDIAATLSRLGFTDADIDAYEAANRPAYFGEFQQLQR